MKWIHRLYIVFLGIIISLTVGFGISAFFPEPARPTYPSNPYVNVPQSCYDNTTPTRSLDCQRLIEEQQQGQINSEQERKKYEEDLKKYNNSIGGYTRTAIFLGASFGALFAIVGLIMIRRSKLVANGLLFGGVFTAVFTRLIISVASLGAYTGGTENATMLSYIEFVVLMILSIAIVYVGLSTLKEELSPTTSVSV